MPTKALLHVFELVHHPEKNSLFCVTISGGKPHPRSEKRRGGEEGRIPGGADHLKKKEKRSWSGFPCDPAASSLPSLHPLQRLSGGYLDALSRGYPYLLGLTLVLALSTGIACSRTDH